MKWIGVYPKDLTMLGIKRIKLTDNDSKKLIQLEKRSYMNANFQQHLSNMKFGKAEIESINKPVNKFLTHHYLTSKLRNQEFI